MLFDDLSSCIAPISTVLCFFFMCLILNWMYGTVSVATKSPGLVLLRALNTATVP